MEKILFIKANPIDTENLRLEKEENKIRDALLKSDNKLSFSIDSRGAVTKDNLLDYLLDIKPNILHISGHGNSENSLFLEDSEGFKEEISIEKFSIFISNFLSHINCVFLNACHSLSEMNNLNNEIPHIIGMRKEIADEVAIDFSASFYKSLFSGKTIKESFKIALDIISLTSFDDELIPKLIENTKTTNTIDIIVEDEPEDDPIQKFESKLVSNEEIDMVKNQKIKKVKFYKSLIVAAFFVAVTSSTLLYFLNQGLLTTIVSAVFPAALGALPFVEIKKNNQGIELMDLYKLKRKRLLTALANITHEDIEKFNNEFYLRITL